MTGHKHAQAMLEYAQDALTSDAPWELWEAAHPNHPGWEPLTTHPGWYDFAEYRRKPKTVVVNEVEISVGISQPPAWGAVYYYVDTSSSTGVASKSWRDSNLDQHMLQHGLAHTSWEAARHHWKALVVPTERK